MLRYDEEAEQLFQSWPNALKRAGSQDCRIAAVALVHNFAVVTANSRYFSVIPGLQLADWSLASPEIGE